MLIFRSALKSNWNDNMKSTSIVVHSWIETFVFLNNEIWSFHGYVFSYKKIMFKVIFFSKMSKKIFTNTFYCIISILHGSIVDKQWSILLVWSWYFNRIEYWIRTHPFILFKCSLKAHRFAFRYKFDAVNAPIYSQYLMHTITSQNS